jgi:hypothetical protein
MIEMGIEMFLTVGNKYSSIITNRGHKCVNMLVLAVLEVLYLRVYKPHFLTRIYSKIGVRLIHGILCTFDD